MSNYIVGDIHGCYDEWITLKDRIEAQDKNAKFILVGDFVDRGPKVMEMIRWAMENITPDGKYQSVMGNHEHMVIQWWQDYKRYMEDFLIKKRRIYGDNYTTSLDYRDYMPARYDFDSVMSKHGLSDAEVQEIIDFFKTLPVYKELYLNSTINKRGKQHFIIVHADFPIQCKNKDESFKKSSVKEPSDIDSIKYDIVQYNIKGIIWNRQHRNVLKNTIVIHGHTPTLVDNDYFEVRESGKMWVEGNYYNIDCGLVYDDCDERNLCALRLEDMTPIYLFESQEWEKPTMVF